MLKEFKDPRIAAIWGAVAGVVLLAGALLIQDGLQAEPAATASVTYQGEHSMIVTQPDGTQTWHDRRTGALHRTDGGPAVTQPDGTRGWFRHGKLDRDDGPAVITSYAKKWYQYGKLHREDGPAVILESGTGYWYKDGERHEPPVEK